MHKEPILIAEKDLKPMVQKLFLPVLLLLDSTCELNNDPEIFQLRKTMNEAYIAFQKGEWIINNNDVNPQLDMKAICLKKLYAAVKMADKLNDDVSEMRRITDTIGMILQCYKGHLEYLKKNVNLRASIQHRTMNNTNAVNKGCIGQVLLIFSILFELIIASIK